MPGHLVSYVLLALVSWISYQWYIFSSTRNKLSTIPTVGSDTFILSYFSAWKFVFSGAKMIQEGYDKYPGGVFKVPTLETESRWLVVVSGGKLIDEIKDAKEEEISNHEYHNDLLQAHYTVHDAVSHPYHNDVVRIGVTKNLSTLFADLIDEVGRSFNEHLPPTDDWSACPILPTTLSIVCRTTNRFFVGQPLCENVEYLEIQKNFTVQVMVAAAIINLFPSPLKGIVGWFTAPVPGVYKKLDKFFSKLLEERLRKDKELGKKWEGRPNDVISWLLDRAPESGHNVRDLTYRILLVNFVAIHTTSITLSNSLLELASRPEYIQPLRKEVEEIIESDGWTKDSMGKMYKLDSFLKESTRVNGLSTIALARKVMKDFKLSNGVTVPKGVTVSAASRAVHNDPALHNGNAEFDGYRYFNMTDSEKSSESAARLQFKHQTITPSREFLLFGLGHHACPGRFFAVNEVKSMMAYILMNYDLKKPEEPNPDATWIGTQRILSNKAQVLFRKRQTA